MAKMMKTKFGLVSPTEAQCLGDLDRWLKAKKRREQKAKKRGGADAKKL